VAVHTSTAVAAARSAQSAKRAKEAGGQIVKDKFSIGEYGDITLVSDPDGNIVGFHSMT
jgi:hypothetical protein